MAPESKDSADEGWRRWRCSGARPHTRKGLCVQVSARSEYLIKLRREIEEEDEGKRHEEEVGKPIAACPQVREVSRVRFCPESAINRAKSNYADDADDYYDGTLGMYAEHGTTSINRATYVDVVPRNRGIDQELGEEEVED